MAASRNWLLIAGVSLPFVFLLGFLITATIAGSLAEPPKHDFLFKVFDGRVDQRWHHDFSVEEGTLRVSSHANQQPVRGTWQLYRFDVDTMQAERIEVDLERQTNWVPVPGLEQVQIERSKQAPDGYRVSDGYDRGPFLAGLFNRGGDRRPRIEKFGASTTIDDLTMSPGSFQFLGWVSERD